MLAITVLAIIITVVYHTSVNSELRFETKDSHVEYINPRRSYRPQNTAQQNKPAPVISHPELIDDDTAEEVEP